MSIKNVILARPNLFIVKEMKKLISDCGYTAGQVSSIQDMKNFHASSVGGIVISTGLSSTVQENYMETLVEAKKNFPEAPILLASMIKFELSKTSIEIELKKSGSHYKLLSMKEAAKRTSINHKEEIVLLEKSELTNQADYPMIKDTVCNILA